MAKIHAPNKEYAGTSAGVSFANGVGETDNEYLIGWFKAHGYAVEEAEPPAVFTCPHCGREYKTEKGLADHIAKEHPDGTNTE